MSADASGVEKGGAIAFDTGDEWKGDDWQAEEGPQSQDWQWGTGGFEMGKYGTGRQNTHFLKRVGALVKGRVPFARVATEGGKALLRDSKSQSGPLDGTLQKEGGGISRWRRGGGCEKCWKGRRTLTTSFIYGGRGGERRERVGVSWSGTWRGPCVHSDSIRDPSPVPHVCTRVIPRAAGDFPRPSWGVLGFAGHTCGAPEMRLDANKADLGRSAYAR